jgi:hypothetical protein
MEQLPPLNQGGCVQNFVAIKLSFPRSLVYTANKIKHVNVNREKLDSKWGETWTGVSNEQPLNPMVHHFSFHINPDGGSNPSVVAKGLLI